ncbi:uncharacterized protein LOC126251639 isoform X2 [Schistocerca nitens]|uniref:uncharacterized protein LOC126251639 isoform X2 n=1 Tax=Schistocerca nitens TaxID=7011 RepID=UPI002118BBBB|nr:uncharacterized protein LOC126251639 isoform X2 [Schistocerca nitens]
MSTESQIPEVDSGATISLAQNDPLNTFAEMWYHVFLWALLSSVFVHAVAAAIAFATLRKHIYGNSFSVITCIYIYALQTNMRCLVEGTSSGNRQFFHCDVVNSCGVSWSYDVMPDPGFSQSSS